MPAFPFTTGNMNRAAVRHQSVDSFNSMAKAPQLVPLTTYSSPLGLVSIRTDVPQSSFAHSLAGNSTASKAWYSNPTDRPVKRLQQNLQHAFPSWKVNLPSESNCTLTATKNVVGRHVNGIPEHHVCSKRATSRTATGEFVHAEQASLARDQRYYDRWSRAMMDTFDATCADGMAMDPRTKKCVRARSPNTKLQDFHDHHVANDRMDGMDGPTENQSLRDSLDQYRWSVIQAFTRKIIY